MCSSGEIASVLARYAVGPLDVEALGAAGGFSGARFWRVQTAAGPLCLRRWPQEHPHPDRLDFIHRVLRHVTDRGVVEVASPLLTREGESLVRLAGACFELTRWMPGRADYHQRPGRARLEAALHKLAEFHAATASFPVQPPAHGVSPGIVERSRRLEELSSRGWQQLAVHVGRYERADVRSRGQQLIRIWPRAVDGVARSLQAAAGIECRLQPCIRDIWHDHVLFSGDAVTGIVDFGAMRSDNVACDIARLVGSLVGDDEREREFALASYQQKNRLSDDERFLVGAFDCSTVLLAGINWLQWICVEGRTFAEFARVLGRLDEILARLAYLARSGAHQ